MRRERAVEKRTTRISRGLPIHEAPDAVIALALTKPLRKAQGDERDVCDRRRRDARAVAERPYETKRLRVDAHRAALINGRQPTLEEHRRSEQRAERVQKDGGCEENNPHDPARVVRAAVRALQDPAVRQRQRQVEAEKQCHRNRRPNQKHAVEDHHR